MDTVWKYERASDNWDTKLTRLGYTAAYGAFFDGRTLASGPVLDIGAGTGAFAAAWISSGGSRELTLVDNAPRMLTRAAANLSRLGVNPVLARANIDQFRPATPPKAILAAHVIEHLESPRTAFGNFSRWLAPGGRIYLVISKPHWCNWLIWLRFRHRWFSEAEICEMAMMAGLQHALTFGFASGPPGRTSLGYIFNKAEKELPCS